MVEVLARFGEVVRERFFSNVFWTDRSSAPMAERPGRTILAVAGLFALTFVVFRHGLVSFPRLDEHYFLKESAYFPQPWDWFVHLISYSRTRILAAGDNFLFRPVHMMILGGLDLLVPRTQLATFGVVSVLMLGATAAAMFCFCRRIVPAGVALLAAVLMIVERGGALIVVYHHISPYLLALAASAVGLLLVMRRLEGEGRAVWPVCILLVGGLTHEMVGVALILAAVLVAPWRPSGWREWWLTRGRVLAVLFGTPVAIYLALNVTDAIIHGLPIGLGPADVVSRDSSRFKDILCVPGVMLKSCFLYPWYVMIQDVLGRPESYLRDIESWPTMFRDSGLNVCLTVVFYAWIGTVVALARRVLATRPTAFPLIRSESLAVATVVVCALLLAVTLGLGAGRVGLRGAQYLETATWYIAVFQCLFILLLVCSVGLLHEMKVGWGERHGLKVVTMGFVALILVNAVLLDRVLDRRWLHFQGARQTTETIVTALTDGRNTLCLRGFDQARSVELTERLGFFVELAGHFFRPFVCERDDRRQSLYLGTGPEGGVLVDTCQDCAPFPSPLK